MKQLPILCLLALALIWLELVASATQDKGVNPEAMKKKAAKEANKHNVEEAEDVTVEEVSEEQYIQDQKQERVKTTAKEQAKPDVKETVKPKPQDDAKTSETDAKTQASGDAKTGEAKPEETGKPETGKAEDSGKAEDGKKEEGKSDEAKGEVDLPKKKEEQEEEHEAPSGIRDPRPCEVCKYLAVELQGRLEETGKVKEYIETGHGIMPGDRKRKDYKKSELRLIEAVHEPHVCEKLRDYDVHAERRKSLRYAKGASETRKTLHWLRHKGVKVDMGMPEEMWTKDHANSPSTEISNLQRLCFEMVERYEDDIEDWYWGHQEKPLYDYLCRKRALKKQDQGCLKEEYVPPPPEEKEEDKDKPKGDSGTPKKELPPGEVPFIGPQPFHGPPSYEEYIEKNPQMKKKSGKRKKKRARKSSKTKPSKTKTPSPSSETGETPPPSSKADTTAEPTSPKPDTTASPSPETDAKTASPSSETGTKPASPSDTGTKPASPSSGKGTSTSKDEL